MIDGTFWSWHFRAAVTAITPFWALNTPTCDVLTCCRDIAQISPISLTFPRIPSHHSRFQHHHPENRRGSSRSKETAALTRSTHSTDQHTVCVARAPSPAAVPDSQLTVRPSHPSALATQTCTSRHSAFATRNPQFPKPSSAPTEPAAPRAPALPMPLRARHRYTTRPCTVAADLPPAPGAAIRRSPKSP